MARPCRCGRCARKTSNLLSVVVGGFVTEVKTPAQIVSDVHWVARKGVSGLAQVRRPLHRGRGARPTKISALNLLSLPGPGVGSTAHAGDCPRIGRGLDSVPPLCGLSAAVPYGQHIDNSTKPAYYFIPYMETK